MSRRTGRRRLRIAAFAHLLLGGLLFACTGSEGSREPAARSVPPEPGTPMDLEVFVYNVEYGGDPSTDDVIREIDADVVGVLESYNRLPEIAENTGYPFHNTSLQILSKYPIHEPSGAQGRYAFIEVRPGYVVAFFNIHLDYVRYGPRLLRKGLPVEEVIESENELRTSALDVPLRLMTDLIGQGYPVFFTGDHNQPSSLDYTEDAVGSRPGIEEPVPWPVSEALLEAGFRDTYREVHPDPVEVPGITHAGVGDRIDYIYAAGPSRTLNSELVGEKGGPDVDLGFEPWTSDHRAVVSTFDVTPVTIPTMVSVSAALLTQGDPLTVAYNSPDTDGGVTIVPGGSGGAAPVVRRSQTEAAGAFELDTSALAPRGYAAVLLAADGTELARVGFWVRDPEARIRVTTDKSSYAVGEPIVVSWSDGPANRWDWIGIYRAAKSDPKVHYYLLWNYTGLHGSGTVPPSPSGSVTMDGSAQGNPWPLPAGEYVAHYLLTDRYSSAGSAPFEVVAAAS